MGLSLQIPLSAAPSWPAITAAMAARGVPVAMRLIDGQPAFPDESPPEHWRELRVASGVGPSLRMITLRRSPVGIELVTWGNADEPSLKLRDALAEVLSRTALQAVSSGASDVAGVIRDVDSPKATAFKAVLPDAHEGGLS